MNLLKKYQVKPRHNLGQNFLIDTALLQREIAYAELTSEDTVLEIGPGIGNLTAHIAPHVEHVIAIEKDRRFTRCLEDLQHQHSNLKLIWEDALKVDLPTFDKVVANLPYKVALPILFKILEKRFKRAIFIFQESLARRICATVGEPGYGRLGISMGRKARFEIIETIPGNAFYPQTDVRSALVQCQRLKPRFSIPLEAFFRIVLEELFKHRDKNVEQAVKKLQHPVLPDRALATISDKLKHKTIAILTPKEFGQLTWNFWQEGGREHYTRQDRLDKTTL